MKISTWNAWSDRNDIPVVWVPSESDRGKLGKLPEEMRPTFAEVDLQADFVLAHGHLPKFNKRMG